MRSRTLLLLILVIVVAAAAVLLIVLFGPGDTLIDQLLGRGQPVVEQPTPAAQGTPSATPTPAVQFAPVVVARADLPPGERITSDLIVVEQRPQDNVAIQAGVTFSDPELVVGQITKVHVSRGQEILRPMIALNPSDIASLGSDLSLYVDQGKVAIAFPIDSLSGAAYALRPGDLVDALMSLEIVNLDLEFQTVQPNLFELVVEADLLNGQNFLFSPINEGRLELIPVVNIVGMVGPGEEREQIPRRVTQLTLQQMEVLWVGSWLNANESLAQEFNADIPLPVTPEPVVEGSEPPPPPTPTRQRPENAPDVVILSMSAQDAVTLKWALDSGLNVDLVLRSQGDNTVFATTSVSLPQIVEQGILRLLEPSEFGLDPRADEVPAPSVPAAPPAN